MFKHTKTPEDEKEEKRKKGELVVQQLVYKIEIERRRPSVKVMRRMFLRSDGKCSYCKIALDETSVRIDHFVPWNLGGDGRPSNLVLCCNECNKAKGHRLFRSITEAAAYAKLIRWWKELKEILPSEVKEEAREILERRDKK